MAGYTKLFSDIITSTIWREDDKTRIVWITLLALADRYGNINASIPGLVVLANVERKRCEAALRTLKSPDPDSRTRDYDGRRIEDIDGGWHILNYAKYRNKMRSVERTEYLRIKQAEFRAKKNKTVDVNNVNQYQPIAEAEAEAEAKAEAKAIKEKKEKKKRAAPFNPPSLLEVSEYAKSIDFQFDAEQFIDFYASKGWMVGKNKMKDWRAAIRTWKRRQLPAGETMEQQMERLHKAGEI